MRPAALSTVTDPARLRPGPRPAREQPLDLTLPDNLDTIRDDVARLVGWGFELVKHDFSTFDAFGRFGPAMGPELTDAGLALRRPRAYERRDPAPRCTKRSARARGTRW